MSYGPLTENTKYLRELQIGQKETDNLKDAEKTAAETYADTMIESTLGTTFSTTSGVYPPLIIAIAEMIGSAEIWRYLSTIRTGQGAAETGGDTPADKLEKRALDLLNKIKLGEAFIKLGDGTFSTTFGPGTGVMTATSNAEEDEDLIFDIRADETEFQKPHDAYNEPAYQETDE